MKKFLMLPVSVGDSFILEKNNLKILVDGGASRNHISELLKNYNINSFDIAVCTHADSDLINGIIGVLKNKKQKIKVFIVTTLQKYGFLQFDLLLLIVFQLNKIGINHFQN